MLSEECIKHRALMMGIHTGDMPDAEFIWSFQKAEGKSPCFGQGRGCNQSQCIWRRKCLALDFYAHVKLPMWEGLREPLCLQAREVRPIIHKSCSHVARVAFSAGSHQNENESKVTCCT